MNKKMKEKLKKIEQMWVIAYDKIFSNPTLFEVADPDVLHDIKQEMLMLQIQDVRDNFDSYRYMSLKKIEEVIKSISLNNGVRAVREILESHDECRDQNQA